MAAPTFVSQGSSVSTQGGATVVWPAGHQADDIGILIVETANQAVTTPTGWTLIANAGTGTAGAAGSTALYVYWKRATSAAESDANVADVGDHIRARILLFRGCETSGSPVDGTPVTAVAASATAVSITMPTTAVDESFAVALVSNATDITTNQTTVGSWANSGLTGFTRITNGNTDVGVGGGIDGGGGVKTTAGAIGATTTTLATASVQAKVAFALKPPSAPPVETVSNGGIYVATGVKATAGSVSNTTATMDNAGIQARLTFAIATASAPANLPPVIEAIPSIIGAVGASVQFPIVVADPEGDTVTLELVAGDSSVPDGAEVDEDESSGLFSFQWTPTAAQAGEWSFFIRASDGTDTADAPVFITVQAVADTTLRELAQALANRAHTDVESARAVSSLLEDQEQLNAAVWTKVQALIAELETSRSYFESIIADLEDEEDPT